MSQPMRVGGPALIPLSGGLLVPCAGVIGTQVNEIILCNTTANSVNITVYHLPKGQTTGAPMYMVCNSLNFSSGQYQTLDFVALAMLPGESLLFTTDTDAAVAAHVYGSVS